MTRATVTSELGVEIKCAKCEDYWPKDPEFFFFSNGKPHSWCKACYVNDPKTLEKRDRWNAKQAVVRAAKQETPA